MLVEVEVWLACVVVCATVVRVWLSGIPGVLSEVVVSGRLCAVSGVVFSVVEGLGEERGRGYFWSRAVKEA